MEHDLRGRVAGVVTAGDLKLIRLEEAVGLQRNLFAESLKRRGPRQFAEFFCYAFWQIFLYISIDFFHFVLGDLFSPFHSPAQYSKYISTNFRPIVSLEKNGDSRIVCYQGK